MNENSKYVLFFGPQSFPVLKAGYSGIEAFSKYLNFPSCAARVGYVIDPYQQVAISDVYLPEHCPVVIFNVI